MAKEMKAILTRSADTLIVDLIGVLALAAMLVGALHLPQMF